MGDSSRCSISLFGYPAFHSATGEQIVLGMRATALFAMLALERSGSSRTLLAELLWPGRHADQARGSLRQCLVEIRHALGRHGMTWPIAADAKQIMCDVGGFDSDLGAIRSACSSKDRAALTAALRAAIPRPLLDDLKPSQAYVDWVATLRRSVDAELELALTSMFARRADPHGEDDWATSAALAHARLLHKPDCPLAAAVLRGRATPVELLSQRHPLVPLPLPLETPPAIYIAAPSASENDSDSTLASAIREEIISALSRFRELRVVALGSGGEAPAILGSASFILSFTLRPATAGPVAIARLATVGAQDVLWGARFPLAGDKLDSAVDQIVERIAAAVAPTIETHLAASPGERPSGALYSRYLSARARSMQPPDHDTALAAASELEHIVAQAPGFISAHLALARLYNTDFAWTEAMSTGKAELARAMVLARAAVAGDRADAHGHSVLGWCHLRQHEWAAARRCFDEAVRLNPYHAERLMEVAYGLIHLGDLDTGEALLRRCLSINPVTSDGFYFDLGMLALVRGDPVLAEEQFAMIVAPDVWGCIATALAAMQSGTVTSPALAIAQQAVIAIWPGRRMPAESDLRMWIETRHPFRLAQHLDRFVSGLESIFAY